MAAQSIHDVFQPFYQCGKLLGFFCYTFDRASACPASTAATDGSVGAADVAMRARTSARNVLLLLLNVLISLMCMMYMKLEFEISQIQTIRSLVLDQSLRFTFQYGIVSTMVTYALLFGFRRRIAGIVSDLCRLDVDVSVCRLNV